MDELGSLIGVLAVLALLAALLILGGMVLYLLIEIGEWGWAVTGQVEDWLRGAAGR